MTLKVDNSRFSFPVDRFASLLTSCIHSLELIIVEEIERCVGGVKSHDDDDDDDNVSAVLVVWTAYYAKKSLNRLRRNKRLLQRATRTNTTDRIKN